MPGKPKAEPGVKDGVVGKDSKNKGLNSKEEAQTCGGSSIAKSDDEGSTKCGRGAFVENW
jgi:hypothetical protein